PLLWVSLGEFLALAASLEHLANTAGNQRAQIVADALDKATSTFLDNNKSPSRKVNELDSRGSHFYLAMYWAQALAEQDADQQLKSKFTRLASELSVNESKIIEELISVQGVSMDIGGYYKPDPDLIAAAMRPSATFNGILSQV
ncbi:MAG: NADP-dependent isocitrate dehydrogenase, partial [Proteobacteria bacterium]|nr:NADP-dependent isocitrate dehydrogenase [Pseudomonadota bacterium]